jgi:hypothetical protein
VEVVQLLVAGAGKEPNKAAFLRQEKNDRELPCGDPAEAKAEVFKPIGGR